MKNMKQMEFLFVFDSAKNNSNLWYGSWFTKYSRAGVGLVLGAET